jgi:hypothetical protein
MNFLTPATIALERNAKGRLDAVINGVRYADVWCAPLFPLFGAGTYVSVQYKKDKDPEEIGIIKNLSDLEISQRTLVAEEISFRYFMPEIVSIEAVKSRHGRDHWTVSTSQGDKEFTVADRKENVHATDSGMVFITDADGCRYKISDMKTLSEKARTELERVLL